MTILEVWDYVNSIFRRLRGDSDGRAETLPNAKYEATPPTLADGEAHNLTLTADGKLRVDDPTTQAKIDAVEAKLDKLDDLDAIKTQTDKWPGADTYSTHNITTANDKTETDMFEITKTTRYAVSIYIDVQELIAAAEGGTVTFKMYNKIDETNYRPVSKADFLVGKDVVHPSFEAQMINHNVKVTVQCSADVTATRTLKYRYITRDLE
jgi:hypothetical protein